MPSEGRSENPSNKKHKLPSPQQSKKDGKPASGAAKQSKGGAAGLTAATKSDSKNDSEHDGRKQPAKKRKTGQSNPPKAVGKVKPSSSGGGKGIAKKTSAPKKLNVSNGFKNAKRQKRADTL